MLMRNAVDRGDLVRRRRKDDQMWAATAHRSRVGCVGDERRASYRTSEHTAEPPLEIRNRVRTDHRRSERRHTSPAIPTCSEISLLW